MFVFQIFLNMETGSSLSSDEDGDTESSSALSAEKKVKIYYHKISECAARAAREADLSSETTTQVEQGLRGHQAAAQEITVDLFSTYR